MEMGVKMDWKDGCIYICTFSGAYVTHHGFTFTGLKKKKIVCTREG